MPDLRGIVLACQLACETCAVACPALAQPGDDCSRTCRCCAHLCAATQHCWNTPNQDACLRALVHSCRVCLEQCGACSCGVCRPCAEACTTVARQLLIFFGHAAPGISRVCETAAT